MSSFDIFYTPGYVRFCYKASPLLPFTLKSKEKLLPCAYYIIVCINSPVFRGNATICNYSPCAVESPDKKMKGQQTDFAITLQ